MKDIKHFFSSPWLVIPEGSAPSAPHPTIRKVSAGAVMKNQHKIETCVRNSLLSRCKSDVFQLRHSELVKHLAPNNYKKKLYRCERY